MIPWTESWDQARKRAKETGKPIFLFLHSPT
ncbi:MAG: thioredoxin family protein [Planctomycetales bacterium]|nr:thioredoxin family protein [Planctomycetales bacterium]